MSNCPPNETYAEYCKRMEDERAWMDAFIKRHNGRWPDYPSSRSFRDNPYQWVIGLEPDKPISPDPLHKSHVPQAKKHIKQLRKSLK